MPPRISPCNQRSNGFSLIEIVVTLVVIGVLAGIAVPRFQAAADRARAAALLSDARVAQMALLDYVVDRAAPPPPAAPGEVPQGMESFLPEGFSFARGSASFAYGPGASGVWSESEDSLGVSIHISDDPALLAALQRMLGRGDGAGNGRWGSSLVLIVDDDSAPLKTARAPDR